jgi:hypothetical protein
LGPGEATTGVSTVSTILGAKGISVYMETSRPVIIRLEVQAVIIIKTTEAAITNFAFIILRELGVKHIFYFFFGHVKKRMV